MLTAQGDLAASRNLIGRAESALREALVLTERLAHDYPAVIAYQGELAVSRASLGVLYSGSGRPNEAATALEGARETWTRLTRDRPAMLQFVLDLARCDRHLGDLYRRTGRRIEAESALKEGRTLCERAARDHPQLPVFACVLSETLVRLGDLADDDGKPALAQRLVLPGDRRTRPGPRDAAAAGGAAQSTLLEAYAKRAESLARSGAHALALPDWQRALTLADGPDRDRLQLRRMDLAMPTDPFAR